MVGLGNVDNVADASKPVSTATTAALAKKQDRDVNLANLNASMTTGTPLFATWDSISFFTYNGLGSQTAFYTNDQSLPITNIYGNTTYAQMITFRCTRRTTPS
jgi:hypothetical protein